jgi:amino acid transporter
MKPQTYETHRRYVPLFHFVTFGLIVVTLIGSVVNVMASLGNHQRIYSASLLVAVCVILLFLFFFLRLFALRAQDRAIRAEENLRHFSRTGRLLDPRLTIRQIIGLRFASDDEFVDLARRAAEEGLSEDQIKRAVRTWRADHDRA